MNNKQPMNSADTVYWVIILLASVAMMTLKFAGVIDWGWWIILFPIYGSVGIFLLLALLVGIVFAVVEQAQDKQKRSSKLEATYEEDDR